MVHATAAMSAHRPLHWIVPALAATFVALHCGSAQAFCRGLTLAGPDPSVTGVCFDGGGAPGVYELFWRNLCVGYSLQKDASKQVTLAQATAVAKQAFGAWSAAACPGGLVSIRAVDEGPVACSQVEYNSNGANQHVIVFHDDGWPHDDPYNSLALTTIFFDATTGEIYDADIEINSADHTIVAEGPATPPAYDLLSMLTHEAGHFLGLAHSTLDTAVMYTFYHPGTMQLTSDDIDGICSIDPSDKTRTTSAGSVQASECDPTPRHGFTTACGGPPLVDGGPPSPDGASDGSEAKQGACSVGVGPASGGLGALLLSVSALAGAFARRVRRRSR
jgi:hypothetical protein